MKFQFAGKERGKTLDLTSGEEEAGEVEPADVKPQSSGEGEKMSPSDSLDIEQEPAIGALGDDMSWASSRWSPRNQSKSPRLPKEQKKLTSENKRDSTNE